MTRSRKKNISSSIILLLKLLTLAPEFLLMTRKSLVVEVCKYSFHFIRNTIATVSYRSEISVPKARVALRAVCEILYDHKYLLNPPPLATIPEESETGEP